MNKHNKLLELANAMISGNVNLIDGCREMVEISRIPDYSEDSIFIIFVGVDSETDDIPRGHVRKAFAEEALKKLDNEADEYIQRVKPEIIKACEDLIKKYSH